VTKAQDGAKVVSLKHRMFLPPRNKPFSRFCKRLSRLKGHNANRRITSMNNSSDTSGIKPATFRFVAQHINHCATAILHLRRDGQRNRQIMKHACDIAVGINHTYIQPAVCKSPTTREVSIEDVEVLLDKLTERGTSNSFYVLHRNTQRQSSALCYTCTIHAIKREASRVLLGKACLFFRFIKLIHYFQHSYILHTLNSRRFFRNNSIKQNVCTSVGFEQRLLDCSAIVLSLYLI
jgi:hypothetical protein